MIRIDQEHLAWMIAAHNEIAFYGGSIPDSVFHTPVEPTASDRELALAICAYFDTVQRESADM